MEASSAPPAMEAPPAPVENPAPPMEKPAPPSDTMMAATAALDEIQNAMQSGGPSFPPKLPTPAQVMNAPPVQPMTGRQPDQPINGFHPVQPINGFQPANAVNGVVHGFPRIPPPPANLPPPPM